MLIAFDGICLADGPPTGVARAFLTGLTAYARSADAPCVLLLPAGAPDPELAGVRTVPAPRGALRRQLVLPGLLRSLGACVLHSPVAAVPLRARCPTVATVHDLPWLHPELGERVACSRRFATRRSLRAAAAILSPSTATADDVRRWLPGRHAPLHVVPHACALGPVPDPAGTAARAGPFLVLGDDRPRKNLARLRAAHAAAAQRCATLPALQFVGPAHGFVDEATKGRLLRQCRAVVHVSRFEGFGLPVLEGLAHGAPVLCSDLPPHREIAGEHALFVPADDTDAIAAGLVRVHSDEALRTANALAGHARAAAFDPAGLAHRWRTLHTELVR